MTALYRAGRQTEALEAFRRAQRELAGISGVAPGPALTEIHRQVLDQDQRLLARCPIQHRLGQPEEAANSYRRAVELFRRTGDRHNEARGLVCLGDTHRAARSTEAALDAWTKALAVTDELGLADTDPMRSTIRQRLGR